MIHEYMSSKEYGIFEWSCKECDLFTVHHEDLREEAISHTREKGHNTTSRRITEEKFIPLRTK